MSKSQVRRISCQMSMTRALEIVLEMARRDQGRYLADVQEDAALMLIQELHDARNSEDGRKP